MHKTIFTWFGNLPTSTKLQGFHYYQGKKYKVRLQYFSLSQETRQQQTLISKLRFLHPAHRIHNELQNMPKFIQVGSGHESGSNKIRLHRAQQLYHGCIDSYAM